MKALAVFTNRGLGTLLEEGGSQAWALDPERARRTTYLVCAQNRDNGDWGKPTHAQGQGFLLAKISAVEPSPEGRDGRYIIRFEEYAEIDVPGMAHGWRNPVRYIELDDYGIDPTKLTFRRVPSPVSAGAKAEVAPAASAASSSGITPLDIQTAKKALAAFYHVPAASIEITIRG
jgi:hypothetical protein